MLHFQSSFTKDMRKSIYVNFVGAPSVGKSLMSAMTYAELKSLHLNAEMVQEYAKMLVYMEDYEMLNCQWMVSFQQYKMLKAMQGKVDFICCDSPLLIGMFFNRYHATNVCDVEKTEAMILDKMRELQPSIYILLERNTDFPFETEGRMQTEAECIEIDKQIKDLLDAKGIEYLSVKSDKSSIPAIVEYILYRTHKFRNTNDTEMED